MTKLERLAERFAVETDNNSGYDEYALENGFIAGFHTAIQEAIQAAISVAVAHGASREFRDRLRDRLEKIGLEDEP